jgi:hypothetical protein
VNRKHRKQRLLRRREHPQSVDRPRLVISRGRYNEVKDGHVVPCVFQRSFAIEETVAVHVRGKEECIPLNIQGVATRKRFYRRTRPDGTHIDDFETVLGEVESRIAPVLRDITSGGSLTLEYKGGLMQFLALQMLRGPVFVDRHNVNVDRFLPKELTMDDVKPGLLAETGDDMELARERVVELFQSSTHRLMTMATSALKVSAVLGSMRWQLLRFEDPVLAYSDQPVVVWPLGIDAFRTLPSEPNFGPLESLEVRVPLSPHLLLLMTWADDEDVVEPLDASLAYAAETNALVIAQADRQWMHQLGLEPPVAVGMIRPLSRAFEHRYATETARTSRRRAQTARYLHRVRNRRFLNDIEVVTATRQPGQAA